MRHTEKIPETTPGTALQRWMRLAKNYDVYLELDFGFAGVMEHPDSLPPKLAIELDAWMENLIRRCRNKDKADRWLRLKLAQQGDILRMECEAAGHPPESRKLREAGAYLEVEDMEESFFMALETGLRRPSPHDAWDRKEDIQ